MGLRRPQRKTMADYSTFIIENWGLFLALIVILLMLISNIVKPKVLGFKELRPVEAVKLMNHENAAVLDVRNEKDFNEGHIINALNIPVTSLADRISNIEKYKKQPVLVYCRTGQQSARACTILRQYSFESVYKLAGGILSWKGENLPLAKG